MSDSDSEYEFQESLYERFVALQDALPIVPLAKGIGSALWICVTAASITLLPFALELEKETAAVAQESMGSSAKEVLGNTTDAVSDGNAAAALGLPEPAKN